MIIYLQDERHSGPLCNETEQFSRRVRSDSLRICSVDELPEILEGADRQSAFINPCGNRFPARVWQHFISFLERGGSWLNIGGPPLRNIISGNNPEPDSGPERNAFHRELGLLHFPKVSGRRLRRFQINPHYRSIRKKSIILPETDVFEMYFSLVNETDRTKLDVFTRPIGESQTVVMGHGEGDRPLAASVMDIHHLWGRFGGSRWLLVNWEMTTELWQADPFLDLLLDLTDLLNSGARSLKLRPQPASCFPGEKPAVQFYTCAPGAAASSELQIEGAVENRTGKTLEKFGGKTVLSCSGRHQDYRLKADYPPGYYSVRATVTGKSENTELETGFWIYDDALLSSGPEITTGKDFLHFDGKPVPVMGTSYMASDVHRWYFLDPNPAVWETDVSGLAADGINMVRTGIWMGSEFLMPGYGLAVEPCLRAFDAAVQTYAFHQIPIIFNLMAFSPGCGNGKSPWFDPASIRWQKELISILVQRYRKCPWVMWDIINEPTLSDPNQPWLVRPNGDRYERAAWSDWLERQHGSIEHLRQAWDMHSAELTDFDHAPLPTDLDFVDQNWTLDDIRHQRAIDYVRFTQDHFRKWLQEHAAHIRSLGAGQLITLGQDEGGLNIRPNPPQHSDVINFTAIHSWTGNDDVLAVILQSKTPGIPHLFGETGAFPQDDPNKEIRLDEDHLWRLYERKFVTAFAARSAGNIHWIWNTAPPNSGEKENAVGGLRASGSEKNEVIPLKLLARFIQLCKSHFEEPEEDSVCILVPYSNMYAPRNPTQDIVQNAVRTLFYELNTGAYCVSEFHPELIGSPALIIVPAPRTLSQPAWNAVSEKVASGCTAMITGPVDYNEYWKRTDRLNGLGLSAVDRAYPVSRVEYVTINNEQYPVPFTREKQDFIEKAVFADEDDSAVRVVQHGKGRFMICAVPLEISDDLSACREWYRWGIRNAGLRSLITGAENPAVLVRPIAAGNTLLTAVVSETDCDQAAAYLIAESGTDVSCFIPRRRAQLILQDRRSGEPTGVYFSGTVQIGDTRFESDNTTVIGLTKDQMQIVMGEGSQPLVVTGPRRLTAETGSKAEVRQSEEKWIVRIPDDLRFTPIKLRYK